MTLRGFANSSLVPPLPSFSERDSRGSPAPVAESGHGFPQRSAAARRGTGTSNAVQSEPGTMPLDDCVRFHDNEDILPASPRLHGPEEPIQNAQGRPGLPPFEDGHL